MTGALIGVLTAVAIAAVLLYQVTDPAAVVNEIGNVRYGVEQLIATALRGPVGEMDLAHARTARVELRDLLHRVLNEATGKWGIRVNQVDVNAVEPVNR